MCAHVCVRHFFPPSLPVSDNSGKKGQVPPCDAEPDVSSAHVDTSSLISQHEKQRGVICAHTHLEKKAHTRTHSAYNVCIEALASINIPSVSPQWG